MFNFGAFVKFVDEKCQKEIFVHKSLSIGPIEEFDDVSELQFSLFMISQCFGVVNC
jgi:hypothetical protein